MYGSFNGHETHMMDEEERREWEERRREEYLRTPEGRLEAQIEKMKKDASRAYEEKYREEEYRRDDEYGEYSKEDCY